MITETTPTLHERLSALIAAWRERASRMGFYDDEHGAGKAEGLEEAADGLTEAIKASEHGN